MPSCKDSTNDDLSSHSLMESTEAHLLAAMQGMQALVKRQQPSVKPAWHKQLKAIQAALRFVHTAAGNEGAPASQGAVDPEQLRLFAQKLREQRKAIGLTQEQRIGQPSPPAAPPPSANASPAARVSLRQQGVREQRPAGIGHGEAGRR